MSYLRYPDPKYFQLKQYMIFFQFQAGFPRSCITGNEI